MITYIYSPRQKISDLRDPCSSETVHLCPLSRAQLLVFRQARDNFHFSVFWKRVCIINLGGSGCVRTDDRGGGVTINHEDESTTSSWDLQTSPGRSSNVRQGTSHRIHHDCGPWSPGARPYNSGTTENILHWICHQLVMKMFSHWEIYDTFSVPRNYIACYLNWWCN